MNAVSEQTPVRADESMEQVTQDSRQQTEAKKPTQPIEIDSAVIEKIVDADHIMLSGPSSGGKSTFLYALRETHKNSFAQHEPLIPSKWIENGMTGLPAKTLFHLNLHRPIYNRMLKHPTYLYSNAAAPVQYSEYASEPVITTFAAAAKGKVVALILITPQSELLERITHRESVEPNFEEADKQYDSETWTWVAKLQNMRETTGNWIRFLKDRGIEPVFVQSCDGRFSLISDEKAALELLSQDDLKISDSDTRHIMKNEPFEYQRVSDMVEVNASNFVQGDRAETAKVIFSDSVKGLSLLDIGCAGGYFCFEAEKNHAGKVVGVELKDTRYRQSLLTRRLIGSNVEFRQTDLFKLDTEEKFDVILFLNVIHHLQDPIRALEVLGSMTQKRLYVEFPTLTDHKFLATISFGLWNKFLNRFPYIGVSLESEGQTFVFTESAIERILVHHLKLFKKIDFVQSHIANRVLAVCHK